MAVVVFGGTGMLGSMCVEILRQADYQVLATFRDMKRCPPPPTPGVSWQLFDAFNPDAVHEILQGHKWAINAIGITKPHIQEESAKDVFVANHVNVVFPHLLADAACKTGTHILQIATDCVFGNHCEEIPESTPHDAPDVYGKTKSLGEVNLPSVSHLRTSVIGPERGRKHFLLEWLLSQEKAFGFTDHLWNGMTTLQFAKICVGIIRSGITTLPRRQHIVPADEVDKYELLARIAHSFDHEIEITPKPSGKPVSRILSTERPDVNEALWLAAGYSEPPTILEMLEELAAFTAANGR